MSSLSTAISVSVVAVQNRYYHHRRIQGSSYLDVLFIYRDYVVKFGTASPTRSLIFGKT